MHFFYLLLNQENNLKNRVNRTVKKSKGDHEKTVLLTHLLEPTPCPSSERGRRQLKKHTNFLRVGF